jgi:beta-glucuronidase
MLNEMIRRDRNKASVILWSVSNETPNNPTRTKFLTNLANEARKLDPTRPSPPPSTRPQNPRRQMPPSRSLSPMRSTSSAERVHRLV